MKKIIEKLYKFSCVLVLNVVFHFRLFFLYILTKQQITVCRTYEFDPFIYSFRSKD